MDFKFAVALPVIPSPRSQSTELRMKGSDVLSNPAVEPEGRSWVL